VPSIAFSPINHHMIYAACGSVVSSHDLRMGEHCKAVNKLEFNKEDINQVVVNSKGTTLAAADDSGSVCLINLEKNQLAKTLRNGHTNICNSVQFRPHQPWEVVSGGLDSRLLHWDYGTGRVKHNFVMESASDETDSQMFNPPYVYSVAVGDTDDYLSRQVTAVARGDGVVGVYNLFAPNGNTGSPRTPRRESIKQVDTMKGLMAKSKHKSDNCTRGSSFLTRSNGGHTACASHVVFARFGEGKKLVSGGNDGRVLIWEWAKSWDVDPNPFDESGESKGKPEDSNEVETIDHGEKVNWLTTSASGKPIVFVADTSTTVSMYSPVNI